MNSITVAGRLAQDPRTRTTASGRAVTRFSLAVERDYKTADGNRPVDFVNITVFGNYATTLAAQLTRGRQVAVEGRLQISRYQADDGTPRRGAEIVAQSVRFLGAKPAA